MTILKPPEYSCLQIYHVDDVKVLIWLDLHWIDDGLTILEQDMKDKQCCSTIIDPKTPLSMEKMEEKNYGRLVEEGGAKVFKSSEILKFNKSL